MPRGSPKGGLSAKSGQRLSTAIETRDIIIGETGRRRDEDGEIGDVETGALGLERLLSTLDIAVRQVLIEARIVNVETNFGRELGVRWGLGGECWEDKIRRIASDNGRFALFRFCRR